MRNRVYELDLIRVLACLMVICMHAPYPKEGANGLFLSTLSYLTAPCIGLFFMVSGALLLPVETDTKTFLKKRLAKIVVPTLVWTIVYWGYNVVTKGDEHWIQTIASIPFSSQGHGVMWFMYTLTGLYLLTPILSRWLEKASKREMEFYLLLWLVSMCYPLLELFLRVQKGDENILYYFSGYAGYFLLGYYMRKYPRSLSFKRLVPFVLMALVAPVLCKTLCWDVDFYSLFWHLSVFVGIMCAAWFRGILNYGKVLFVSDRVLTKLELISNLSFGIYLSHIFIMRYVLWKWDFIVSIDSYVLQKCVIAVFTFIISLMFCLLVSRLPKGDYIIGYKVKR